MFKAISMACALTCCCAILFALTIGGGWMRAIEAPKNAGELIVSGTGRVTLTVATCHDGPCRIFDVNERGREIEKTISFEIASVEGTRFKFTGLINIQANGNLKFKFKDNTTIEPPAREDVSFDLRHEDGSVHLSMSKPLRFKVDKARLLLARTNSVVTAFDCERVVGCDNSSILAVKCKELYTYSDARAKAQECGEVVANECSSIETIDCERVFGEGTASVSALSCKSLVTNWGAKGNAEKCDKVVARQYSFIEAIECKQVSAQSLYIEWQARVDARNCENVLALGYSRIDATACQNVFASGQSRVTASKCDCLVADESSEVRDLGCAKVQIKDEARKVLVFSAPK